MVPKITTVGWDVLIEWKDGMTTWVPMKEIKKSNPVELAEYTTGNGLVEEPALKWWVPDVIQKQNILINKVKSRYWRTTHKFGIQLPHTVKEALKIDAELGTMFWGDAIWKEMKNVRPAFEHCNNITIDEA